MNSIGNMSNIFSSSNPASMSMSMNIGVGSSINTNDLLSLSSMSREAFGGNTSALAGLMGGSSLGFSSGMGMVPGFSGTYNSAGSMFGGQMQQMQQMQQMMQMMMMMLQMQMMQMMNQMMSAQSGDMASLLSPSSGTSSGSSAGSASGSNGASSTSATNSNAPSSGLGADICKIAASRLGDPYSQAKRGQGKYVDCSYLTQWTYKQKGINLAGTAGEQLRQAEQKGWTISKSELQPGDLVFWGGNSSRYKNCGHVGIYVGNGECIEASSSKSGVVKRKLWGSPIGYARPR